jgi:hypothetical protein
MREIIFSLRREFLLRRLQDPASSVVRQDLEQLGQKVLLHCEEIRQFFAGVC